MMKLPKLIQKHKNTECGLCRIEMTTLPNMVAIRSETGKQEWGGLEFLRLLGCSPGHGRSTWCGHKDGVDLLQRHCGTSVCR